MRQLLAAILLITAWRSAYAQAMDFFDLVNSTPPDQIRAAIDKGADVNARDSEDWTPLMDAADYNLDPEVIGTLLKAGADVNAWDT